MAGEGSQAKNSSCRSTQPETLGRRVVLSKNCVMENRRGVQVNGLLGRGKKINTSYYVPGRDFTEADIKIHHYPMSK